MTDLQHLQLLICGIWGMFILVSTASLYRMLFYTSSASAERACEWLRHRSSPWHWLYVTLVNVPIVWAFCFVHYDLAAILVTVNFLLVWLNGVWLRGWHLRRASRILMRDINELFRQSGFR